MASGLQPKQPSVTNYDSNPAYGVVSCSQVHTESRSDVSVHDQGKQISSFTQNRFNATPNNLDDEPQDYIYPNPDPTPVPSMDPNNMVSIILFTHIYMLHCMILDSTQLIYHCKKKGSF